MSTPHSAGPHALGYLYQIQYALFSLLTAENEESTVIVEGLDDVELGNASFLELQQLKHHIGTRRRATLSNSSPDLWKSLRVWSEGITQKRWSPLQTKLTLITTARAAPGSIAAKLRADEKRDTTGALQELAAHAAASSSQELSEAVKAFRALKPVQQRQLVEALVVVDQAPNIGNLEGSIKQKLRLVAPPDRLEQVYQYLVGWWYAVVAMQMLNKSLTPITWIELKTQLDEIVSQLQRDRLPTFFARAEPDEAFNAWKEGRTFVRQLDFLLLNAKSISYAVKDYYRAFQERTKWAGDKLLVGREIEGYEADLHERWDRFVNRLTRNPEFAGQLDDDAVCLQFGRRVLDWIEEANFPIRSAMPPGADYITRGSYHIMADQEVPAVYWHPKFLERMGEIVEATSAQETALL